MADSLYNTARQAFAEARIAWSTDNIKLCLVSRFFYTVNLTTDQYLNVIPGGGIVATSANFSGKTSTNGICGAANVPLTAVSGIQAHAIVLFKDTGVAGTSQLIAYFDTVEFGLPITPNGNDIDIIWPNGGIFAI